MNEQTTKEKALQFIRDFKIGEYKPMEDTSNLHYDYVWLEAIDIAISSERERIIQEVEKEYKQSDNLQSARVVLRDLLKRLKVKLK
jgi:hypothetical protein